MFFRRQVRTKYSNSRQPAAPSVVGGGLWQVQAHSDSGMCVKFDDLVIHAIPGPAGRLDGVSLFIRRNDVEIRFARIGVFDLALCLNSKRDRVASPLNKQPFGEL